MSRPRRRVTVDNTNSVSEDTEKRKPSVFERLGPGGGRAKQEAAQGQDHVERCRFFLKRRKCPYGSACTHLHSVELPQTSREESPPEDLRLRVKKNQAAHCRETSSSEPHSPDSRKNLPPGRDKIKSTIVVKKAGQDSDEMEDELDRANPAMQDLEKQRLQIQQELKQLENPEEIEALAEASPNMSSASSPDPLRTKKGLGKKKGEKKKKHKSPGVGAPLSPTSTKSKGMRSPSPTEMQRVKEQKKRVDSGEEEHHRGGKHKKKKHEKRHQLEPEKAGEVEAAPAHAKHKLSPFHEQQLTPKLKEPVPPEFASPVSKGSHRSRSSPEPMGGSQTPIPKSRTPSPLQEPARPGRESPPPHQGSKERQKEKVKGKKKKDKSKKKAEVVPAAKVEEPFIGESASLEDYMQMAKSALEADSRREEKRKSGGRKRKRSPTPSRRSASRSPSPSSHHKQSLSPEPAGKVRHKHSSKERQRRVSSERRKSRDRPLKKRHKRSVSPHHPERAARDRDSPRDGRHARGNSADKPRRGPGDSHQSAGDSRRRHSPSPRRHSSPPHSRSRPSPEPSRRGGHPDDKPDPRHRHGQSPDDRDAPSLRDGGGSRRLDLDQPRSREPGELPRDRQSRYQDAPRGDQRDRVRYEGYPDRPVDSDRYASDRASDRQAADLDFGRERRPQDRDRFPKDGRHAGDPRDSGRDWGHRQGRSDSRGRGPPDDLRQRPPGRDGRGDRYDDRGMLERSSRRSEWEAQQPPPDTQAWDDHRGDRRDFPPRREGFDPQRQGSTPPEERGSRHEDRRLPDLRGDHPDHRGDGRDDRLDRRGEERGDRREDRGRDDRRRTGRSFSPSEREGSRMDEKGLRDAGRPSSREDRGPRDDSRGRRDDRPGRDDRDRPGRDDRHGRDPRDDRHDRGDHGGREDRGREDAARKEDLGREDRGPRDPKRLRDDRGDERGGREERAKDDHSSQGSREDRLNREERGERDDRGPRGGNQDSRRNRDSHSPAPRSDRLPPKDGRGDRSYSEERGSRDRRGGVRKDRGPERPPRQEGPGGPRRSREDPSRAQAEEPPPEMFRFGQGKGPPALVRGAPTEKVPLAEEWGLRRAQASQPPRGGRDGQSPAGSERRGGLGEGRSPLREGGRDARQFTPLSPSARSQSSGGRRRGPMREEMERLEERRERPPPLMPELERRLDRPGLDRDPMVDERGDRFLGQVDLGGGRPGEREEDLAHTASPSRRLTEDDRRASTGRGGSPQPPSKRGRESSPASSQHSRSSLSAMAGARRGGGGRNARPVRGGRSRNVPAKQPPPRGQPPPGDRKRVEEIRDPAGPRPLLELNLGPPESAKLMEREMMRDRPMGRDRLPDRPGMRGGEGPLDRLDDRGLDRGMDRPMDRPPERPQDRPRERSSDRVSERSVEKVAERGVEKIPEHPPERARPPVEREADRGKKRKRSPPKDVSEDPSAKRRHLGPGGKEAEEGEGLPVAKEMESVAEEGVGELCPPPASPSLPPLSADAGGDEAAFSDWSDDDEQVNILLAVEEEKPAEQPAKGNSRPQEAAAAAAASVPPEASAPAPPEVAQPATEPAKDNSGAVTDKQEVGDAKADDKTDKSLAEDDPEYEQISSDEDDFTEETDKNKTSIVDILDLDWSSLSQERKPAAEAVSTLQRFSPGAIFSKLGISRAFAGEGLFQKVKNVCKEFAEADKRGGDAKDGGATENGRAAEEEKEEEEKEGGGGRGQEAEARGSPEVFLHDVASLHAVAWERQRSRRQLLSSLGPNRRALCARADLAIRRQLCKVNQVYEPAGGFSHHLMDAGLCKLSIQLFRQDRSQDSEINAQG